MLTQHTFFTQSQNSDLFHLEFFENQDGSDCFYLNFVSLQLANENFITMRDVWGLPVILEGKRVEILQAKDSKSPGVYQEDVDTQDFSLRSYIGVRFQKEKDAIAFSKMTQFPHVNPRVCVCFDKRDLMYANYLIDKGSDQVNIILDLMSKLHLVFGSIIGETHRDIMVHCIDMYLLSEPQERNYIERFTSLNKRFSIYNSQFLLQRQNKKVDVSISYDKSCLYLTCTNPDQFKELDNMVSQWGLGIAKQPENHAICIYPTVKSSVTGNTYGVTISDDEPNTLAIEFEHEMNRYYFLKAINMVNVKNNKAGDLSVSFKKDLIPKFIPEKVHTKKHRDRCTIS